MVVRVGEEGGGEGRGIKAHKRESDCGGGGGDGLYGRG